MDASTQSPNTTPQINLDSVPGRLLTQDEVNFVWESYGQPLTPESPTVYNQNHIERLLDSPPTPDFNTALTFEELPAEMGGEILKRVDLITFSNVRRLSRLFKTKFVNPTTSFFKELFDEACHCPLAVPVCDVHKDARIVECCDACPHIKTLAHIQNLTPQQSKLRKRPYIDCSIGWISRIDPDLTLKNKTAVLGTVPYPTLESPSPSLQEKQKLLKLGFSPARITDTVKIASFVVGFSEGITPVSLDVDSRLQLSNFSHRFSGIFIFRPKFLL